MQLDEVEPDHTTLYLAAVAHTSLVRSMFTSASAKMSDLELHPQIA